MNTLEELLSAISNNRADARSIKRTLKVTQDVDTAARLANRLNQLEVDYDTLQLMKIQHDLIAYIKEGGDPVIKQTSDDLYEVSIPGSRIAAYVNSDGLSIIKSIQNGEDPTVTQVRRTNESSPHSQ